MPARPDIHVTVAPHSASLDTWGLAGHEWWGLITWYEDVRRVAAGGPRVLVCSAWAPARYLRSKPAQDYSEAPRVELQDDITTWPEVVARPPRFWWPKEAIHVGILGEHPYPLPDGCTPTGRRKAF